MSFDYVIKGNSSNLNIITTHFKVGLNNLKLDCTIQNWIIQSKSLGLYNLIILEYTIQKTSIKQYNPKNLVYTIQKPWITLFKVVQKIQSIYYSTI